MSCPACPSCFRKNDANDQKFSIIFLLEEDNEEISALWVCHNHGLEEVLERLAERKGNHKLLLFADRFGKLRLLKGSGRRTPILPVIMVRMVANE